jgi:ankyrin repeat protein
MASGADERLVDAAKGGNVKGITAALLAGADSNTLIDGWTPLLWAAFNCHVAAIAALLAAGARVDAMDRNRETPLMYAAMQGHTAAVDALLAAGADVHHTITFGETALHRASMSAHLDTARALIEAGARTNVRDKSGKRPIDRVGALAQLLAHLRRFRAHAPLRHCTVMHRFGRATQPPRVP